jgi:hypothetical protein
MMTHIPTRQLPARELIKRNIAIPFWHTDDDKPVTYHLTVMVLPLRVIDELTILARKDAAVKFANPNDNRDGSLDYEPTNRERHALIRHMLLNRTEKNIGQGRGYQNSYDQILFKIEKAGIDVRARQLAFKKHAYALIAQYYPTLRLEGEDALWRWQNYMNRKAAQ